MYKIIENSNLIIKKPNQLKKEGVIVKEPLQNSFCSLIIGKPASGKTYLIKQLILDPNFYGGKFDNIIFITPSMIQDLEFEEDDNWQRSINIDWIYSKIDQLNQENLKEPQMLIIFDDQIANLKKLERSPQLGNLIFNRRHLLKNNGIIHIIITAQKYILTPTYFRTCFTNVFFFKVNNEDWKAIKRDLFYGDIKGWDQIVHRIFTETSDYEKPFIYIDNLKNQYYRNFDLIQF